MRFFDGRIGDNGLRMRFTDPISGESNNDNRPEAV